MMNNNQKVGASMIGGIAAGAAVGGAAGGVPGAIIGGAAAAGMWAKNPAPAPMPSYKTIKEVNNSIVKGYGSKQFNAEIIKTKEKNV